MEPETLTIAQLEELMASTQDIPADQLAIIKASLLQHDERFKFYEEEYAEREAKLEADIEALRQNEQALEAYKQQYEQARQQEERENQQVLAQAQPLSDGQYAQMMQPLSQRPPVLSLCGGESLSSKPFSGHVHQSTVQVGWVNPTTQTAFLRVSHSARNGHGQYNHISSASSSGSDGQQQPGYHEGPGSRYDETLIMEQCLPLSLLSK